MHSSISPSSLRPRDELFLYRSSDDDVEFGFTWRGRNDENDFSPGAGQAADAWARLAEAFGAEAIVQGQQVHGSQVAVLTAGPIRRGLVVPETDALITTVPRVLLAVRTADCVPVLLWAPRRAVAAVHAGWRGLVRGILAAAVRELRRLGLRPSEMRAAVGPAIGPCCYEIGLEVAEQLSALPGAGEAIAQRDGTTYADLPSLAVSALAALGVPAQNIRRLSPCTSCHREVLFSYRRDGEMAGRQVSCIMLISPGDSEASPPEDG